MSTKRVVVIGGGLAGCEASYSLANKGIEVILIESKRVRPAASQKSNFLAELVCTNSLKSLNPESAHGLLKLEMKALNSLVLEKASLTAVGAGDALAVDRELFGQAMTDAIKNNPKITLIDRVAANPLELLKEFGADFCVIATGPLTCTELEEWIVNELAGDDLYFYDAIAPVVDADSLDYSKLYFKDRHKDPAESADYLNAPMNEEQYYAFVEALVSAKKVEPKDFEELKYFESCLPIDTMAERGRDTPRFSCMKPIGLELDGQKRPFAVVQLRKENLLGSAYNMVGFQTRLTYGEQLRVFKMIPGFEDASFVHMGSIHRNTFLNAKKLLNSDLSSQKFPQIFFAGQITGVEGYTESAACGLYVAQQILRRYQDLAFVPWPVETSLGSLINYIMTCTKPGPSNVNFGLMPLMPLTREQRRGQNKKRVRKQLMAARAQAVFSDFCQNLL